MIETPDPHNHIIAVIDPRPGRRVAAVGGIGALGALLMYVAATHPPAHLGWLLFLVVTGGGFLTLAWYMWGVTGVRLDLTHDELCEHAGRTLCSIDEVAAVDRGFFAFKPANGFRIRLKRPTTRGAVYAPGLWWRIGRIVMVGGVTSGAQAKAMADLITVLLAKQAHDS